MDYKVDQKKLKQVFKLAGCVLDVELSTDKDGNSRGFAVVEYQHPVEAVQAISMLDHQLLFDRRMTVRMDKITKEKLPDGLGGIGMSYKSCTFPPLYSLSTFKQILFSDIQNFWAVEHCLIGLRFDARSLSLFLSFSSRQVWVWVQMVNRCVMLH